jgi:hypothetical protein
MRRYILLMLGTAAVIFPLALAAVSMRSADLRILRETMAQSRADVAVLGNSAIRHASPCDGDPRSIPQLIAAATGARVADLSKGGMQLSEYGDVVQVTVRHLRPGVIVAPITPAMANDAAWDRAEIIHRHFAYSILGGSLPVRVLDTVLRPPSGDTSRHVTPYDGHAYGSLEDLRTRHFPREKAARTCPESDGTDRDLYRYVHWLEMQHLGPTPRFEREVERIAAAAVAGGTLPLFVIMPANVADLAAVGDATSLERYTAVRNWMVEVLRRRELAYIDLFDRIPKDRFVDRWCACGHLGIEGRRQVADAIASAVRGRPERATKGRAGTGARGY